MDLPEHSEAMLKTETEKNAKNQSKLVFAMFYALGTVSHVPQTFYITANDYWMYKFRDPNDLTNNSEDATKTDLQTQFSSTYSIVSNICMVLSLLLTVFLAQKISVNRRIVTALSLIISLFVVTLMFVWIDTDTWQGTFFGVSLIVGGLLNGSGACLMVSLFELATQFPPVYIGAILSGQSVCGIITSLLQVITLAIESSSQVKARHGVCGNRSGDALARPPEEEFFQKQLNKEEEAAGPLNINRQVIFSIAKKISIILFTMVLTAGSMVSMHPGVTSLIESVAKGSTRWGDLFFLPVCSFLTFNVFDFLGRETSIRTNLITNKYIVLAIAVVRLVFIPLLLFCNIQPRHHLPVVFREDYAYSIFLSLFAFSSGYLMNICVVGIGSVCKRQEMKIATALVVIVMVVSLATCSFFKHSAYKGNIEGMVMYIQLNLFVIYLYHKKSEKQYILF
ncbi:hypothetical protein NQ317_007080 [Molorchus minor]|uniref:Equilibrative nucleoside transporter 3 n=1 Tax=Molorchus minor TaxID=1323400 RepID=A0ABQ9K3V7_9CUCU|nr:hypothetical protein NQ317_007080 [Molorchus minor]